MAVRGVSTGACWGTLFPVLVVVVEEEQVGLVMSFITLTLLRFSKKCVLEKKKKSLEFLFSTVLKLLIEMCLFSLALVLQLAKKHKVIVFIASFVL